MAGQAIFDKLAKIRDLWQVPAVLTGAVLLALGWYLAMPEPPVRDLHAELRQARDLILAGQFDEAVAQLNAIEPVYGQLLDELKIQYQLARGDAYGEAQRKRDWNEVKNHLVVIDCYSAARRLGHRLNSQRVGWMADSLIALGQVEEAKKLIESAEFADEADRQTLKRGIIEAAIARAPDPAEIEPTLIAYLETPNLAREHRIWAVGRQAELMIKLGRADEAAPMLVRWLQRLNFAKSDDLGQLMVLLGRAQLAMGERRAAEQWFVQARQQLAEGDPFNGEALTGLGRIRFAEDNIPEALSYFDDAAERFPSTHSYVEALVGRGECQARLGAYSESLASYDRAVKHVLQTPAEKEGFALLSKSLAAQRDWRYAQHDFELALQYLDLEKRLHGDTPPIALLLKLASTHEQVARKILGLEESSLENRIDPEIAEQLAPQQRGQVSNHYEQAADYYYQHAVAVSAKDDYAHGESLWRAADCYDRAGLHAQAIEVFEEYANTRSEDPRQLEVMYRLAQAYQAEGQFDKAIALYKRLNESNPKSPEAYSSLVPLARCYLAEGAASWDQAEHVLRSVVTDHEALRPESNEYREALIELGRLYYRRGEAGDYENAIARLKEAVDRYGADQILPDLLFQLADAYRKSVVQIDQKLTEPLAPSQRTAFVAERARRLSEAMQTFDNVIHRYEQLGEDTLTQLQKLYLRNAYFYRADCAYDLGKFEGPGGAIELYDQAAQRYESDPAVLAAMIQIVNSYCELGKYDLARTANERAKWHLGHIPEEEFNDPNLPMNREHWQRWLDWTSELTAGVSVQSPAGVEP